MLEVLVALALFVVVAGAVTFAMMGARGEEKMANLYLTVMENAAMAIHEVRTDLRQAALVPGKPVNTHSFRVSQDGTILLIRRCADVTGPEEYAGAWFLLVEYRLVPTGLEPGTFFLQRTEATM